MAKFLDKRTFASLEHSELHIVQAKHLYPKTDRWARGAAIVNEFESLVRCKEESYKGKYHGYAALNRGGQVQRFWVVKNPGTSGLHRGDKVFRREMRDHLERESGTTFRDIATPKKDVRESLSRMAGFIADMHHPCQYGFVPKHDCVQSAAKHVNAKVVYMVDIESAFDQVHYGQVVDILRGVFLIGKSKARMIADLCCVMDHDACSKHMYQGNPMAPVLFNIRMMWAAERLDRLCRANGLVLTCYADDIAISSDTWTHFSRGFKRTVLRILQECGLRVNAKKCRVARVDARKMGSYDITGLTVDFDRDTGVPYVRPLHRKRVLKKAAYIAYLRSRGLEFSEEAARDGGAKRLEEVQKGLEGWATRKPRSEDYPPPRLPLEMAG